MLCTVRIEKPPGSLQGAGLFLVTMCCCSKLSVMKYFFHHGPTVATAPRKSFLPSLTVEEGMDWPSLSRKASLPVCDPFGMRRNDVKC